MVNTTKGYKLSPSALNLFLNCPKCFWLDRNKGKKRPRGIYPSLPGGMDAVIKNYFDNEDTLIKFCLLSLFGRLKAMNNLRNLVL